MKKLTFGKFLLIYVSVFVLIIFAIAVVVWNKLEDYQSNYNKSKDAGDPVLFIEELVDGWKFSNVEDYIAEYGAENLSKYNSIDVLAEVFTAEGTDITYKKNDKYTEVMPVYDIYSDVTRLAVVSLKPEGANDEFGFHKWQIRDLVFDTNTLETTNYIVKVAKDSEVTVNGMKLELSEAKKIYSDSDVLSTWVSDKYGFVREFAEYELGACVSIPNIEVQDINGNPITEYTCNDNVITYNCAAGAEFTETVEPRVLEITHSYISNIYYKLSFYQMSKYLVDNSDAYAVIKDVQSSIVWGWHPDVVEIIEESVYDYVRYSDTLFSCKYYAKIYKADEDEEYQEVFNYHLLFEQVNGQYFLTYFNLN